MSEAHGRVELKPGHVRPIYCGHPWVFAQAVARVRGGPITGDEVDVVDPEGRFLGRGFFSAKSAIAVRIHSRRERSLDGAAIAERIERACEFRRSLGLPTMKAGRETTGYRLVHAEGDELPGLIVDRFGDVACVQLTAAGMKQREGAVFDALRRVVGIRAIVDRTPKSAAQLEGVERGQGVVRGELPAERLEFCERGLSFSLPLELGQKTGFYFDQRPLRARVELLAHGKTVLDTFSFVGAFAMAASRGGATRVTAVDQSAVALEVGAECAKKSELGGTIDFVRDDARHALDRAAKDGGVDLCICDPPKFAPTRAAKASGLAAYEGLATQACKAVRPGGILVFCSCSAAVREDELMRALAIGARKAGRSAWVFERDRQGADHPVPAAFPEGQYLKSLLARIDVR